MSKVIDTLKASGHEVVLVLNVGSSGNKHSDENNGPNDESTDYSCQTSHDEFRSPADQNAEPSTSHSLAYSDDRSSSQDTLDDIIGSPASFEGDTDFSGLESVAITNSLPLDLHRTSSAPLIDREQEVALDSSPSSIDHCLGNGETGSLELLASGDSTKRTSSFEKRLQMRTSSDGVVEKPKKPVSRFPPPPHTPSLQ